MLCVKPAGLRSTTERAVPVQRPACEPGPMRSSPACCPSDTPKAWEPFVPAGFKLTTVHCPFAQRVAIDDETRKPRNDNRAIVKKPVPCQRRSDITNLQCGATT